MSLQFLLADIYLMVLIKFSNLIPRVSTEQSLLIDLLCVKYLMKNLPIIVLTNQLIYLRSRIRQIT